MTGAQLNRLLAIEANHALYREDGLWYHNLKRFPGVLFDKSGYVLFITEDEYINNPNLQIKKDLHITGGIQVLPTYQKYSENQLLLIYGISLNMVVKKDKSEEVVRTLRKIDVILRNRATVAKLKRLYEFTCQICLGRLKLASNEYYIEIHHIIPLGRPHNGKDSLDNMICVCPNCHVLLDFKAIPLTKNGFKLLKHTISPTSMDFHNEQFFACAKM
ncbi:HNH endonuclease signature motif containing protein [Mucilaginibacter sp. CAU 1740]|uniref:HNH endonuclease signature motif containing protein n=1 Tax=Mucilaginibacter sp. CAU 1740 TaxID=3140365 RepID=UPI00325BC649